MLPDLSNLLVFLGTGFALNITPGPDMTYIAARSASGGRRAGIASALGVGVGTLFHIAVVGFGVGTIASTAPAALTFIRYVGAAYLVYLGVRTIRSAANLEARGLSGSDEWAAFRQGVITNVLNPKVALFFLAFLPQFVDASRGSTAVQVMILGLMFDVTGTVVNLVVAIGASRFASRLRDSRRSRSILNRICGAILVSLGIRLAFVRA